MRKHLIMLVCVLLTGCGNGQGSSLDLNSGGVGPEPVLAQPGSPKLEAQLTAELQKQLSQLKQLGASQPSTPPLGIENSIFDLQAKQVEDIELEEGQLSIRLTWTEQLVGDYDQNGEVGISDIQPLVANYGSEVEYLPNSNPDSKIRIPAGNPDGDSALNWYLARIDGDKNGSIGLSDVTALAQHWQQRVDGFEVLRKHVSASEFEVLPIDVESEAPTLTRSEASGINDPNNKSAPRMGYVDIVAAETDFQYVVVPVAGPDYRRGSLSNRSLLGIDLPPTVELVVSPDYGIPEYSSPVEVTLDASAFDPNNLDLLYSWDIDGDGVMDISSGNDSTITYIYTREDVGIRSVGVVVMDAGGNFAKAETELSILGATFDVTPKYINPGETIAIDFSANMNPNNPLVKVSGSEGEEWEIDLDNPDSLPIFEVEIQENYIYNWRYCLTYEDGSAKVTKPIEYGFGLNKPPLPHCNSDEVHGLPGLVVNFDASTSDPGGWAQGNSYFERIDTIESYEWDFGDGQELNTSEPFASHEFLEPDTYTVTLVVTDSLGLSNTNQLLITVTSLENAWEFTDISPINLSTEHSGYGGPGRGHFLNWLELSEVNGHLALAYTELRDDELVLVYTYAHDSMGTSWSEPVEVYRPVTDCQLALIEVQGLPAIGFAINKRPHFILAENAEGSAWNPPVLMLDKKLIIKPAIELMVIDDIPGAIICPNGRSRILTMADDALGSSWDYHYYGTTGRGLQNSVVIDGQPAFCAWYSDTPDIRFNRAADLNLGPWDTPQTVGRREGCWYDTPIWNKIIDGNPAYISTQRVEFHPYYDGRGVFYQRADDPLGLSWDELVEVDTWTHYAYLQGVMSLDDDRPAITYFFSNIKGPVYESPGSMNPFLFRNNYCITYLDASDSDGLSWSKPCVLDSFSYEGIMDLPNIEQILMASMLSLDGRPRIVYINPDTSMLTIAAKE